MAVTIQREIATIWTDIQTLALPRSGDSITLAFNEPDAQARNARLWVAGVNNLQPDDVGNRQGKEAVSEGWVQAKLPLDAAWTTLTFPTTFPLLFDDLTDAEGCFEVAVGASGRTEFMIRFVVPDGADTTGEMRLQLAARWMNA